MEFIYYVFMALGRFSNSLRKKEKTKAIHKTTPHTTLLSSTRL